MSLDLVKCGMCGKAAVVGEGRRHVCDSCRAEELNLYSKVRTFVQGNPDTEFTIKNVADILKVDERKIHHLVESGYFKLTMRKLQLCEQENRVFLK